MASFRGFAALLGGIAALVPAAVHAAAASSVPDEVKRAVVYIECGNRQGSGTLIHGDGYILTNAHVLIDLDTQKPAAECTVALLDRTERPPRFLYSAIPERWVFNPGRGQDFAILKITDQLSQAGAARPFPFVRINEFTDVNEPLHLLGYSDRKTDTLSERSGKIIGFQKGFIQTDAEIRSGDSGGAALDGFFHLIGAPTRILTLIDGASSTQSYEVVDIRAVLTWLDTFGRNTHDTYFLHVDSDRYHQQASFVSQETLGCQFVARTLLNSTVHCLLPNEQRWVFPNEATFLSWYPDFKDIVFIDLESIAPFRIMRNATFKPGTLVKSQTDAKVYVVVDAFGTLRWIPTEEKARTLWGANWAGTVKDIPDEFFGNYTIGEALE